MFGRINCNTANTTTATTDSFANIFIIRILVNVLWYCPVEIPVEVGYLRRF
jgi:hypothetical protein